MSIKLDISAFERRAERLKQLGDLLFVTGLADEQLTYQKSTAIQTWLLGYEFPETIILSTAEKLYFLTSMKKSLILDQLKDQKTVKLEIFKRSKDPAANKLVLSKLVDKIGPKIGVVLKDVASGKSVSEWEAAFGDRSEKVDVSSEIAVLLSQKDESEMKIVNQAAKITCLVLKNFFIPEMGNLIDQNKKISHEKMALMIENSLLDDRKRSKLRLPADIVVDFSEWCYPPIVQSGGNYDLKPSAASDTSLLHAGTIVVSFGVRYKSYCSNVARTFMINPEKEKEKNYEFLLKLQAHVLTLIKDGVQCNQVYDGAVAYIQEHRPDLVASFTKNCGFGVFVYNSDWNRIPRISIFAFE